MPKVLNKHHLPDKQVPPDAVYIGRGSKWGNPFAIGRDGTRAQVIQKYRHHLTEEMKLEARRELRGKDLVCFCSPQACHGDVLLEVANG